MDCLPVGTTERPASLEELECWGHTSQSLKRLAKVYEKEINSDTIGGVNNLILATPVSEITAIPEENVASIKSAQTELAKGISNISRKANQEISALDDALERINVLLALRKAQECASTTSSRDTKRRGRSDSSSSGIPLSLALGKRKRERELSASGTSVSSLSGLQSDAAPRKNIAGHTVHRARSSKPKKETIVEQPAFQPGRKVVFRMPKFADTDDDNWIYAIITRFIGPDKHGGKYEVEDPEPDRDGQPGMKYIANIKSIIPLPLPKSPAYVRHHITFPVGSVVLALYPDTTCFYPATVVVPPSPDWQFSPSMQYIPTYKLKFDGEVDDDLTHSVSIYWVVEFPSHLL